MIKQRTYKHDESPLTRIESQGGQDMVGFFSSNAAFSSGDNFEVTLSAAKSDFK